MPKTYRKYRGGSRTPRSSRKSSGRKSSGRKSSGRKSSGRKSSGRKSSGRRSSDRKSGRRSSGRKSPESPWIQERRNKKKSSSPKMSPIFKKRMADKKAIRDKKKDYFLAQSDLMNRVNKKRQTGQYRSPRSLRAEHAKIAKMPGISEKMADISRRLAQGNFFDN